MKKLLIITASIGLAAVISTVIAGALLSESTVVSDPYATALRWDAVRKERLQSGWNVSIVTRTIHLPIAELIISVHDGKGEALTDAAVDLQLTLPATDRYDSEYHMKQSLPGMYRNIVNVPVRGRWLVRILVHKGGKFIPFDETIQVEQ